MAVNTKRVFYVKYLAHQSYLDTIAKRPKRRLDRQRYKLRNVVERFIGRIKHCRRVATRYDKLAVTFLGFVQFASLITLL